MIGGRGPERAAAEHSTPEEPRGIEFLLRFTEAGQVSGYPTDDLEERVLSLTAHLDLAAPQISAAPTIVVLSFGSLPEQRSYISRVRPRAVDLDAIARLDDLVNDVVSGRVEPEEALERLNEIRSRPINSLLKMLTGQTVSGIDAGFNTFVTAMSIAYGLMLSTVVLPRRFTAFGMRGASA